MLLFGEHAGQSAEGIGRLGAEDKRGLIFGRGYIELIAAEGLRCLAHGEPEREFASPSSTALVV